MLNRVRIALYGIAVVALLSTSVLWAQAIFATLTGIVTDPSGAVVANAKITLRDAGSGSERNSVTDAQGFYTFASIPVGTYGLTVEAPGFQTYKATNIAMGGGERRNVNASLTVGSTNQTIEVTGTADVLTPVDSGEKASVLTTEQLQNYVQVGSNAAEYLKIMPGFGNQNGASNKSNYSGQIVGINGNGDGGTQSPLNNAFSYNGLPGNTLDIVADGAHVSDPGCNCDTPVNPNSDFLQEFRVQMSNFGADAQKGPMVITSVTRAGGSQFHGSGFFTARNYALNSNDSYSNATGVKKPENKFYYPGGSIGGPVVLPWTKFNRNHDKLFFFTGYEYFYQVLDTGVLNATVPTQEMRQGNFCNVASGEGIIFNGQPAKVPTLPGGGCQMPASLIDPGMQSLMNLYPLPNTSGNGFNYAQAQIFNQNNQQWVARADYNVSDNTKIFVRYNLQRETQPFPVGLWWRQTNQVPYPTSIEGKNKSDSVTGTLTHVFSPTMTNEAVFAYTFIGFPNVFADPSKVNPSNVGFKEKLLLQNTATAFQIPSFGGKGQSGEAALIFNPGGFEAGGASSGLYANKYMPSVSDTLTKVFGTHSLKAGFFYEWIRNAQPASNNTNGSMQFVPTDNLNFTTGNAYADMLEGNLSSFGQANFNRINDIAYHTYEGFIQDSWKVTPRLTVDAGLRITHFTPWSDNEGFGYSTFTPSLYTGSACASAPTFCGFQWNSRNSSVPLGGFPTRAIFWQPRFGLAYDPFGKGNTVIRGGWGRFYYHSGQFTNGLDTAAGSASITVTPNSIGNKPLYVSNPNFTNLGTLGFAGQPGTPGAVDSKDDRQPYTDSYSFTISQRTPLKGLLEIGYVGNQSHDLQSTGGFGSNINLVPAGALFKTDPVTGAPGTDPFNATANNYRPFRGYGDLNQATNNLYANYNAFQLTWVHQSSRGTIQFNYTLGKSLGIVNGGGGGGALLGSLNANLDPFNLGNDYGVQPGDRRHIFNAAYSINLPSPVHDNKIVAGLVNGWQLSGVTQFQSGANLTGVSTNGNFNIALNGVTIPGTTQKISNQSILGTNAIQLNPTITCNPTANLGPHQWINNSCFSVPTQTGQNGPTILPAIYGPAFFNSDLGLFKNFQIKESMKLQFRITANNFLNHPLWSMQQGNALNLSFSQDAAGKITQSNPQFGIAQYKTGQRIVQLQVKFYF